MMMGTTADYGLPYPEGTDYVASGDDAIQALAERLAHVMAPSWVDIAPAAGTGQNAAPAGVTVEFPGLAGNTADFTLAAGLVTYTGTPRPFIIAAHFLLTGPTPGQHTGELYLSGGLRRTTAGTAIAGDWTTHSLQWAGILPTGATVQVRASGPGDAGVWNPALSIMSTGARA